MLEEILRFMEGDTQKCILCDRRRKDVTLSGDGVGICKVCYEKYIKDSLKDYFDTNSRVRRLFAPFVYEGEIRHAIHELKFANSPAYAKPIGELVADALPPYYLYSDYDMIVPVPLHPNRMEERGYNQAELIADTLSERLSVPLYDDVLFRIRDTKRQMTLSRSKREENVEGAFFADSRSVSGKRVLLIDDIYTVGATVKACAKELIDKGAIEVSAIVVCANFLKEHGEAPRLQMPVVK